MAKEYWHNEYTDGKDGWSLLSCFRVVSRVDYDKALNRRDWLQNELNKFIDQHGKCCVVMGCLRPYEELAHIDYKEPLAVLPLCKIHHKKLDEAAAWEAVVGEMRYVW